MLLIDCPWCGRRPEIEFRHAGEAHVRRPVGSEVTDAEWEAFLYTRANEKGLIAERWRHVHGCGRFFNALRHSVTDVFVATYKPGEPRPEPAPHDEIQERQGS